MKHRLFTILGILSLFLTKHVHAQSGEPPIPNLPSANEYVLDTLNWLSDAQEQEIDIIARQLDVEGKAQIYVATLDDCGSNKTQYRRDIFDAWNIGSQKQNGGLLILVCWYEGDTSQRSVEIKTDEKMQRIISDALTAAITEKEFVPAFQENQPGVGLVEMVITFDNIIRNHKPAVAVASSPRDINVGWFVIGLTIVLILLNRVFKAGAGGGWFGGGDFGSGGSFGGDSGGGSGGSDGGGSSTSF
jgi:uncharacterized protein